MINTEHFTLLAGNPSHWDSELTRRVQAGEDIVEVQRDQYQRGRLSATLVKAHWPREGWMVRGASSLQIGPNEDFITPANGRYTQAEAIRLGTEWANQDPEMREFYVRNSSLEPRS